MRRWPARLESLEEHGAGAGVQQALVSGNGELFDAASNDELPVLNGPQRDGRRTGVAWWMCARYWHPIHKPGRAVAVGAPPGWSKLDDGAHLEVGREQMKQRLTNLSKPIRRRSAA